jgi:hypothetical protein
MTSPLYTCPKCDGLGLRKREGAEADADIHPILSRAAALCERCGGSGKARLTTEEIAARTS